MLLSEAIKLGSLLGPQQFGLLFGPDNGSCALGAACLALGIQMSLQEAIPFKLLQYFPGLRVPIRGVRVFARIVDMNDTYKLTREAIADYLVENGLDCESVIVVNQSTEEAVCV